jgi:uncharacterized protein (TIGR00251 family)
MPSSPAIEATATGVRLHLLVQPRASITGIAGIHGDRIKIRLASPPVEGAANEALVSFLAKTLGTSRSAIEITAGKSGRRKTVVVTGVLVAVAQRLLGKPRTSV